VKTLLAPQFDCPSKRLVWIRHCYEMLATSGIVSFQTYFWKT